MFEADEPTELTTLPFAFDPSTKSSWNQLGHEFSLGPSLGPHGRRSAASKAQSAHGNASRGEGAVCRNIALVQLVQGLSPTKDSQLAIAMGFHALHAGDVRTWGRQGCSISDNIAGSFTRSITEQILLPFSEHFQCLGGKRRKERQTETCRGMEDGQTDAASVCSP